MKKIITNMKKIMLTTIGLSLFVFGFIANPNIVAQNDRDSASGQGSLPTVSVNGKETKRQFSLSAHENNDGSVKGNAVLHNPAFTGDNGQKYQLQIDISCMKVMGNIAIFGGTIKRTNDSNLVDAVFFAVEDNGNPGRNSDRISRVYFFDDDPTTTGDPQICQNSVITDFVLETIINGNIHVRGGTTP